MGSWEPLFERFTEPSRQAVIVAQERAHELQDDGRSEIDASDGLLALIRNEQTGPLLLGLGVDEAAVRNAIERAGRSEEPPAASGAG